MPCFSIYVRRQRAEKAVHGGYQPGGHFPAHSVDPAHRMNALRPDRKCCAALGLCSRLPALDRRIHGGIQTTVLGRIQAGVRRIAADALFLVLLRTVGGNRQVAEIDVQRRWAGQRRIDLRVRFLPADRERGLHRRGRGGVGGVRHHHGEAGSVGEFDPVDRPAPALERADRGGDSRAARRTVQAGYRPRHAVMVALAGDLQG